MVQNEEASMRHSLLTDALGKLTDGSDGLRGPSPAG